MLITRKSTISNKVHSLDLNITARQLAEWEDGKLIQYAMPQLTAAEREFVISGVTQAEWDEFIGDE